MVPDQQETMFDEPAELEQAELEIVESEVDQFEPYDEHVIDEQITSEQVTHEQVADEEVAYEVPQPEAQASTPDCAPASEPYSELRDAEAAPAAAVHEVGQTPILTVDDFAALEERVLPLALSTWLKAGNAKDVSRLNNGRQRWKASLPSNRLQTPLWHGCSRRSTRCGLSASRCVCAWNGC